MEELLKLIKANLKEGADFAAIETLVKGNNPLAGVKTVEEAKELIAKTDLLRSANDSLVSIAVKSHDDKFTAEKLPELLKAEGEKIRKEINPKETPEQKTNREQKERIDVLEGNAKRSELKTSLLNQATEIGYTGDVELFVGFGDKASDMLKDEAKRYKTDFDNALSDRIKEQFPDVKPRTSVVKLDSLATATDSELYAHAQAHPDQKQAVLDEIKRRTMPK